MERNSTKLRIPHPEEQGCQIVGILEQLAPQGPTQGRKLALILHGTMGHKDYLFQRRLAERLPMDSFRFDFRGNHETGGTWKQGALGDDLVDLKVVVEYLKVTYGYVIDLVVGHSRGSIVAMRWICTTEEGRNITGFVNASGRYRMALIKGKFAQTHAPSGQAWAKAFAEHGYATWNVTVAKKQISAKIYPEDIEEFANWDNSYVKTDFPPHIHALTVHGLRDGTVPPYDAVIYADALSRRNAGTHTLNFVEDADHNFTGKRDEVVKIILDWWSACQQGHLRGNASTGLWLNPSTPRSNL